MESSAEKSSVERTAEVHHCLSFCYHWLPLATIDLVGDN